MVLLVAGAGVTGFSVVLVPAVVLVEAGLEVWERVVERLAVVIAAVVRLVRVFVVVIIVLL